MPSYQYTRDIKPEDLKPETPPDYNRKQKAKNWWQYHKVWIAVGLVAALLIGLFIRDIVTRIEPDVKVGVMCPYNLPDGLVQKLQQGLGQYIDDMNGDGHIEAALDVYTVSAAGEAEVPVTEDYAATGTEEDVYTQMAGVVRLTAAFEEGNPVLFLLHPEGAEDYQRAYQILGHEDGTLPEEGVPAVELGVRFGDIPALAQMDLTFEYMEGTVIDGHQLMDDFLVGVRALGGTRLENQKGGPQRWEEAWALLGRLEAGTPMERGE